jgi:hypothetical protein
MKKYEMFFGLRIMLATAVSCCAGFFIHHQYGAGWARNYQEMATAAGRMDAVLQEPYPTSIMVIAVLTALVPTLGKVLFWLLLRNVLPGASLLGKAAGFTGLMMLGDSLVLRQPLMNYLIGLPLDVCLVLGLERWLIVPATCLLIVLLAPPVAPVSTVRGN